MVDSFVKNDDIVVRKFIVSPSAVSFARILRFVHAHVLGILRTDVFFWLPKFDVCNAINCNLQNNLTEYKRWSYDTHDSLHVLARSRSAKKC